MIKIQIIRILLFTMSSLGRTYFDIHLTLPKKGSPAFPRFRRVSSLKDKKMVGVQSCFSVVLLCLVSWPLFSFRRGLEKPLTGVSGGMVSLPGITKVWVPTLWLWRQGVGSHKSEGQSSQEANGPGTKRQRNLLLLSSPLTPHFLLPQCPLTPP